MIRSTFRNLMILVLIACFGASFFIFRKTQDLQLEIAARENDIIRLRQELENTQSLNVALNELDNLTITEQTATQLDILRHLGLEQSNLNFELESRDVQTIGSTSLYVHNVRIRGDMAYETALQLADRLQGTKKIVLDSIELSTKPNDENNHISLNLSGKIYGLEKNLEALAAQQAEAEAAASAENPQPQAAPATDTLPVDASQPESLPEVPADAPATDEATAPEPAAPEAPTTQEAPQ